MEIRKEEVRYITTGYKCDVCGKEMRNTFATLYASDIVINEDNGERRYEDDDEYSSWERSAMEQCHLCAECYVKVTNFIQSDLGGEIKEI